MNSDKEISYNKNIDISMLSEGIWYIGKDNETKTLLARKLEDLPEAMVSAKVLPIMNDICDKIRVFLRKLLPKDTFEEYIIRPKAVLQLYNVVVREIARHELNKENGN